MSATARLAFKIATTRDVAPLVHFVLDEAVDKSSHDPGHFAQRVGRLARVTVFAQIVLELGAHCTEGVVDLPLPRQDLISDEGFDDHGRPFRRPPGLGQHFFADAVEGTGHEPV